MTDADSSDDLGEDFLGDAFVQEALAKELNIYCIIFRHFGWDELHKLIAEIYMKLLEMARRNKQKALNKGLLLELDFLAEKGAKP